MSSMTTKRKQLMERVASLPEELLDEVEELDYNDKEYVLKAVDD